MPRPVVDAHTNVVGFIPLQVADLMAVQILYPDVRAVPRSCCDRRLVAVVILRITDIQVQCGVLDIQHRRVSIHQAVAHLLIPCAVGVLRIVTVIIAANLPCRFLNDAPHLCRCQV